MIQTRDINVAYNANRHYDQKKDRSNRRKVANAIFRLLLLLLFSSFLIFLLIDISPIDPITFNLGENALLGVSPERASELKDYWSQDTPLVERYVLWIWGVLHLDFGYSLSYGQDVATVLLERGTTSLFLLLVSWLLSAVLGYFLGVIAGLRQGKLADKIISGYCWIMAATPTFWISIVVILIFCVNMKLFPVGFSQDIGNTSSATIVELIRHATLPCLVLVFTGVANYCLHTRQKTINVVNSDYVKFEKTLSNKTYADPCFRDNIVRQHVLKNVSLPAISIAFSQIAEIIGGSVVVESVFSYPGLGNAIVNAAVKQDANLLAGITLVMCVIVFVGNTISNYIVEKRS